MICTSTFWIADRTIFTMKTEEKNVNIPKVRVAVLGNVNVGKSALTVRYLTRRFIGEYRSNTDLLYRQILTVSNGLVEVEIIDVSGEGEDRFPLEQVQWADACVVVYSITDRASYDYAVETLATLQRLRGGSPTSGGAAPGSPAPHSPHAPIALLANKADLDHLREVQEKEGRCASVTHNCAFHEVSVAENSAALYVAMDSLVSICRGTQPTKARKFSVTKMLGTLIGAGSNRRDATHTNGTVVACHKGDLHKNRVLKRRQNFTATASL